MAPAGFCLAEATGFFLLLKNECGQGHSDEAAEVVACVQRVAFSLSLSHSLSVSLSLTYSLTLSFTHTHHSLSLHTHSLSLSHILPLSLLHTLTNPLSRSLSLSDLRTGVWGIARPPLPLADRTPPPLSNGS